MRVFNHKLGIMVDVKEPKEIKKDVSPKKKPAKQNDSDSDGVSDPDATK